MADRCCLTHGKIPGLRYCPECYSAGKPWTEAQADAASVRGALETAAARIAQQINLERDGPEDAAYAHAISIVLNSSDESGVPA